MILKGKAFWYKLAVPGDTFDKSGKEWTVDIVPDEESMAAYKAEGYTSGIHSAVSRKGKTHAGGADYIKLSKPTTTSKGEDLDPPIVVDEYGNDWDPKVAVGNGSTVQVILGVRKGDFNGTPWKKPTINKVMIQELVPYGEDFEYANDDSGSDDPTDDSWTTEEVE